MPDRDDAPRDVHAPGSEDTRELLRSLVREARDNGRRLDRIEQQSEKIERRLAEIDDPRDGRLAVIERSADEVERELYGDERRHRDGVLVEHNELWRRHQDDQAIRRATKALIATLSALGVFQLVLELFRQGVIG